MGASRAGRSENCPPEIRCLNQGRNVVNTYLQGRRVAAEGYRRPSGEVIQLIRKLRWIGMDEEAEQVQSELRHTSPTGGVLTAPRETD